MPSLKITKDNSKKLLEFMNKNTVIILYHWNNCGHCRELEPLWQSSVNNIPTSYSVCDIEFDDMKHLDKDITTTNLFPAIIAYKNKKICDTFQKSRTIENISEFINKHISNTKTKPKAKPKPKAKAKPKAKKIT